VAGGSIVKTEVYDKRSARRWSWPDPNFGDVSGIEHNVGLHNGKKLPYLTKSNGLALVEQYARAGWREKDSQSASR
jgi:hypothetical protein